MPSIRDIKQAIDTTKTIEAVSQALGDIAISRIKETRQTVTQNIYFFQEVAKLYKTVKTLALKDIKYRQIYLNREENKLDKSILLLITSKEHFYGNLDSDLVSFFISQTNKTSADRLVVGSSGAKFLKAKSYNFEYELINFQKESPSFEELKAIANKIFKYKRIFAFHTKFITLLNQAPTMTDINFSELDKAHETSKILYITEPEISKIMDFFESQILVLLLQAIFLEVNIAHLAARMITMNQAEINAGKQLELQRKGLMNMKRQILNLRIIETYSGRKIESI